MKIELFQLGCHQKVTDQRNVIKIFKQLQLEGKYIWG